MSKFNTAVVRRCTWLLLLVVSAFAIANSYIVAVEAKESFFAFQDVTTSVLHPEYDFNKVKERMKLDEHDLARVMAPELKKLEAIAWSLFLPRWQPSNNDEKNDADWKWALNSVGLPYELFMNDLGMRIVPGYNLLDNFVSSYPDNNMQVTLERYIQYYTKNFVPYNVELYKKYIAEPWSKYANLPTKIEAVPTATAETREGDATSVLQPEFDFKAVEKRLTTASNTGTIRSELMKKLAPELKKLVAIAWYFYVSSDDPSDDNYAIWENALKKAGLPPAVFRSSLGVINGKTLGKKGTIGTLLNDISDKDVTSPVYDALENGTFAPSDILSYKNHIAAAFSEYARKSSDALQYTQPQKTIDSQINSNGGGVTIHTPMIAAPSSGITTTQTTTVESKSNQVGIIIFLVCVIVLVVAFIIFYIVKTFSTASQVFGSY